MILPIRTLLSLALITGSLSVFSAETANHSAITPEPRQGGWMNRHEQFNKNAQANQGNVDLIFVGDSITQGWEGRGKDV